MRFILNLIYFVVILIILAVFSSSLALATSIPLFFVQRSSLGVDFSSKTEFHTNLNSEMSPLLAPLAFGHPPPPNGRPLLETTSKRGAHAGTVFHEGRRSVGCRSPSRWRAARQGRKIRGDKRRRHEYADLKMMPACVVDRSACGRPASGAAKDRRAAWYVGP